MNLMCDHPKRSSSVPSRITPHVFLALLLASLIGAPAGAAGLESTDPHFTGDRPPGEGPTPVTISLYLNDIDSIDDIGQRFNVDLFLRATWTDARLALPEVERTGGVRTMDLEDIWTPRGVIVNDRGLDQQLPRVANVDDLGTAHYQQRLTGELAVDLHFKDFPFDVQQLPIAIVSYQYTSEEVVFSPDSRILGDPASFSTEGWKLSFLKPEFSAFHLPASGIDLPLLTFVVTAQRIGEYYLLTMFLPMSLIVLMAWSVFWLRPDIVPPRISISTAAIFSLIAFGFSIRLSLPKVSYLTRADLFVVGCTMLVFAALGVAILSSRWATSEQMDRAHRLNVASRWIYLAIFVVMTGLSISS